MSNFVYTLQIELSPGTDLPNLSIASLLNTHLEWQLLFQTGTSDLLAAALRYRILEKLPRN
jgi:hypothetical protein